jgi:hypothetical protein
LPQLGPLVGKSTSTVEYLKTTTLVGLLPVPHPIFIRRYQHNPATELWFLTHVWGQILLRHIDPPVFLGTRMQLFMLVDAE